MTKKSDAPAIRFKGFSDAWEQRKLEDYLTVSVEKNTGNIYGRSDVLSVSGDYGIVNQIEFQGRSFAGASVSNYGVVQTGDVVYTKSPLNSNPYGIIKTNKGKPGIVSTLYAVYHPKENAFSDFIQVYFEQHARMNNYMHPLVNKGAKNDMKVSAENALKGPVCFPSRIEQESVSAFFSALDNLITLHQRKCANLCSPSQVVFSLLFATSTFSWEQRKLGELGKITTGSTPSTSIPDYYSDDGIVWVTPTDICENITFESARKLSDLGQQVGRVVPKNTILVTCIASIGKNTMLGNTGSFNQQINGLTPNENESDPYFLLTESALWSAKMKSSAATGTMQIVNRTEFSELKTWLPSLIEQQAISDFFRQLDNLITLHQRECISFTGRADRLILTANKKRTTSSWEQRKVGDLLIERNQQAPMSDEYPLMAFIANEGVAPKGERYDRSALVTDTVNKLYKKTEKGDFIYSSNNLETGSIGLNKYGKACISPVYSIFEPTGIADSDFLGRRLVRKDFINAMVKWRQGVIYGQWRIHESDFLKIEITVPSVEEQRKIGTYLDQLDHLITLHQRKPNFYTGGYYAE